MSSPIPSIEVTVKDNSLGLQDTADGDALAIIGPGNDDGALPLNKPLLYGSSTTIETDVIDGPLVEAGCDGLVVTGRPVILVRCDLTTAGAMGEVDIDGVEGTAVPVATSGAEPIDDYEVEMLWVDACTVGVDGGTYYYSLDGGRHYSPLQSLGTAYTIALEGGASFTFEPPEADLVDLVNELRTDVLAHIALTSGSVHGVADTTSDDGVGSAATDYATAITLLNTLRTGYEAHRVLTYSTAAIVTAANAIRTAFLAHIVLTSGGVHGAADESSDDDIPSAASDLTTAIALLNALRLGYAAHRVLTAAMVHGAADNTNAVSASAATNAATAITLMLELATKYNAHRILTAGTVHGLADSTNTVTIASPVHGAADSTNAMVLAAATTNHEAVDLANQLKAKYNAHRVLTSGSVHGLADSTNATSADDAGHGTLEAGDVWSCRTTMPRPAEDQLDDALKALQQSSWTYETILILPPIQTTSNANAVKTRWLEMQAAYKYKKLFGAFRPPAIDESEAAYLAAYKAEFDPVQCYGLSISAGAEEHQSQATRPRTYMRPPAWLAAMWHVKRGPDISIADVAQGAGALPLASTIKDVNGNPKHHDEFLESGLDAARALTLRTWPGRVYVGQTYVTLPRTLAAPGTDYMFVHYWAVMIRVLDVAIPRLIGLVQAKAAPDEETGRIQDASAKEIEGIVEAEIREQVTDKAQIVSSTVRIDRTVNLFKVDRIPVVVEAIPYFYNLGFRLTAMLKNPQL